MPNSTILASGIIVFTSLMIGITTGYFSFKIGSDSLLGVNSPPENPTQKINDNKSQGNSNQKFQVIPEKTILVKVYDYVQKQKEASKVQSKSK